KSRSSSSINSSLQDIVQGSINISLCGTLKILKNDDLGNPLGGATFQITPDPTQQGGHSCGATPNCFQVTDNDSNIDTNPASGVIEIPNLKPGTYQVCESAAPPGFIGQSTCFNVTIVPQQEAPVGPFGKRRCASTDTNSTELG